MEIRAGLLLAISAVFAPLPPRPQPRRRRRVGGLRGLEDGAQVVPESGRREDDTSDGARERGELAAVPTRAAASLVL